MDWLVETQKEGAQQWLEILLHQDFEALEEKLKEQVPPKNVAEVCKGALEAQDLVFMLDTSELLRKRTP